MYTPDQFLTLSKGAKLYPLLTRILIRKSFDYFEGTDFLFSVNLSLDDLLDYETREFIYARLEERSIGPQVTFEFLETEQIETYPEVIDFIQRVKGYGCTLAVDDFGSGYSNFDLLLKLPFDYIKIDGSLIRNIDTDRKAQILVETLIGFAEKLGAKTIAEYVFNPVVFNKIKSMGVHYAQGFFIGKPEVHVLDDSNPFRPGAPLSDPLL